MNANICRMEREKHVFSLLPRWISGKFCPQSDSIHGWGNFDELGTNISARTKPLQLNIFNILQNPLQFSKTQKQLHLTGSIQTVLDS